MNDGFPVFIGGPFYPFYTFTKLDYLFVFLCLGLLSLLGYPLHLLPFVRTGRKVAGLEACFEIWRFGSNHHPQSYRGDAIAVRRSNPHSNQYEHVLCVTPVADCHLQELLPKPNSASTVKNATCR